MRWLGSARLRARREALIARIGALAVSGQPLDRVLDGILAEMAREGLRGGSIALVNENDELYIAAAEGELSEEVRRLRLPVGQGIMGRVALTGMPALIGDLDRPDGGPPPANRNVGSNARMRSLVAVPIRVDGAAFGVLEVDSQLPYRFTEDDVRVLSGVALAISGAVQHAGPLRVANEQLRRRVNELTLLQSAARALTGSLDVDTVLAEVLRRTSEALLAPACVIVVREGVTLRTAASFRDGAAEIVSGPAVPVAAAPQLAAAIEAGAPAELPPDALEALPELAGLAAEGLAHAVLAAPIAWPGTRASSLLIAASPADRQFDDAERLLLEGVVHIAELALGNAERYRKLAELVSTDPLTGLANAQAFERALAGPHPDGLAVISLDVDRLKEVNDVAGHEAGDETLRRVAATLSAVVDGAGIVGRTGGDDFAVLLERADEDAALDLAERIRLAMHGLPVTHWVARVSVGVAVEERAGDAREVWWAAAEAAGTAKVFGGDGVIRAGGGAAQPGTLKRRWERVLGAILDGDGGSAATGVVSVYQPVVRIGDRALGGYEALARFPRALDGGVEGLFAAAQHAGRGRDLDWVCRRAAFEGARALGPGTPLFVNVGVWSLLDPLHDVDQMLLLLEHAGRSPRDVVLELTERELVSDYPRLSEVLAEYRDAGFRFAMDDVGEGHWTLELLSRATPEYVKLASSLVAGAGNVGMEATISAVVMFAERTGAIVVAEGIETEAQAEFVMAMGVDVGQGWLLGRPGPLPVEERGSVAAPFLGRDPAHA